MAVSLDVAKKLLKPTWRDVEFVPTTWDFSFDQAHAAHLYPDRDAGYIEGTGRNPAKYQFSVLFRVGLSGEKDIFPGRWQRFVAACADRSSGVLVHPLLGSVKVKCVSCSTKFDPNKRDGVDVDVAFVETSDAEDELSDLLNSASPITVAVSEARNLDEDVADVSPAPEYPESLSPSALESMKALSGAVDQFKRGVGNIAAAIDTTLGGLEEFAATLASIGELGSDPNVAKALRSVSRCSDALLNLSLTVTSKGKPITQAVTQTEAAADAVASFFGMTLDEFLRLNPRAASRPRIARNTTVFVFA